MLLEEKDDPRRGRCRRQDDPRRCRRRRRLKVLSAHVFLIDRRRGSFGLGFWREERGRERESERLTTHKRAEH